MHFVPRVVKIALPRLLLLLILTRVLLRRLFTAMLLRCEATHAPHEVSRGWWVRLILFCLGLQAADVSQHRRIAGLQRAGRPVGCAWPSVRCHRGARLRRVLLGACYCPLAGSA